MISSTPMLAKLLAQENLTVFESVNATTASFDLKNRVITLPKNDTLNEGFTLHETGHAVYTDRGAYVKLSEDTSPSLANIVEDARIERLVQKRFPGSVQKFKNMYKFLKEKDINVSGLNLLDRLNLKAKFDNEFNIKFNSKEQSYFDKMMATETMDDVVEFGLELYEFIKDNPESSEEESPESSKYESEEESPEDESEEESPEDESEEEESPESSKYESEEEESPVGSGSDLESEIQDMIDEELESQNTTSENCGTVDEVVIPRSENISTRILEFKNFIENGHDGMPEGMVISRLKEVKGVKFKKLSDKLNKVAVSMAADFERNKKANEYSRTSVSVSGSLNTRALHKYKISDEIFNTVETLKEGKSHGVQLLIDFSSSMRGSRMRDVINQTYLLVKFCRIVNIPYEVFAFADINQSSLTNTSVPVVPGTAVSRSADLVKLSDNNMSEIDSDTSFFITACKLSEHIFSYEYNQALAQIKFDYGDTPLADSILQMLPLSQKFKSVNSVQHTSIIIFTDGNDTYGLEYCKEYTEKFSKIRHYMKRYTLVDAETGIEYKSSTVGNRNSAPVRTTIVCTVVESMLSLLSDRTESSVTYIRMGSFPDINIYSNFKKEYKKDFNSIGMFTYEPITSFKMVLMKDPPSDKKNKSINGEVIINPYMNKLGKVTTTSAKSAFRSQSKNNRKVKAFSNIIIDSICSNF